VRVSGTVGGSMRLKAAFCFSMKSAICRWRSRRYCYASWKTVSSSGSNSIRANVRVLAATHIDLSQAVAQGRFREDLYYRLKPLHLHTPPLRMRGSDKLLLAEHFIEQCTRQFGLRSHLIADSARARIMEYHWPGNIRELRNCIQQAMVLCEQAELSCADLGLECSPAESDTEDATSLKACRKEAERNAIEKALEMSGGCVEAAADYLDVSRAQLYRLIKIHEITTA
jgi:DNA-binding NtrC family response regulator